MSTGATFGMIDTPIEGDTIYAADWVAEFTNILNKLDPSGIGSYFANATEMQATSDPYPGGVASVASSLLVWMQQVNYMFVQITGKTYWFQDPATSIADLDALIVAGTKMLFAQAAAPTGWTKDTDQNDKAIRIVSGGSGGTAGGSLALSSSVTGSHTLLTAEIPSHTHTVGLDNTGGSGGVASEGGTQDRTMNTGSTGGGGGHDHPLALAYLDVIKATKD